MTRQYTLGMTIQIAVKLPDEVVAGLDRLVGDGRYPNRSQVVRRALELLLSADGRHRIDSAFARGFAEHPESPAELSDAMRLAREAIDDEPWERWW